MNIILQLLGHFFLLLGIVGIFLPILPTTPFLLLATFLYSKSNPKIHQYILNHKYLGPPVKDWETRGVIRTKAKILAVSMILLVMIFRIPYLKIKLPIIIVAEVILLTLIIFISTRPSK